MAKKKQRKTDMRAAERGKAQAHDRNYGRTPSSRVKSRRRKEQRLGRIPSSRQTQGIQRNSRAFDAQMEANEKRRSQGYPKRIRTKKDIRVVPKERKYGPVK